MYVYTIHTIISSFHLPLWPTTSSISLYTYLIYLLNYIIIISPLNLSKPFQSILSYFSSYVRYSKTSSYTNIFIILSNLTILHIHPIIIISLTFICISSFLFNAQQSDPYINGSFTKVLYNFSIIFNRTHLLLLTSSNLASYILYNCPILLYKPP